MGIELLIKPGASGFMRSDTQKIGPSVASNGPVSLLAPVVTGATIEWPSPSHFSLFSFWIQKSKNEQSIFELKGALDRLWWASVRPPNHTRIGCRSRPPFRGRR
jgi:hypothetical protein